MLKYLIPQKTLYSVLESQGLESVSIRTFLLPRAPDFKGMLSDKVSLM